MKIIFLSGFRGSGKDATYKVIRDKFHQPNILFIRISIADTIKDIGAETYNFDRKLADDHFEKDKKRHELNGKSIREVCREIADEKQKGDPTCFSRVACNKMRKCNAERLTNNEIIFVVTDYRYKHDYDEIKNQFSSEEIVTIRINRKSVKEPDREREREEYALEDFPFDYIINNDGSLDDLCNSCVPIIEKLIKN
jgi:dephospho-CoA kinase